MHFTRQLLSSKNQKGVALMLAMFCVMVVFWLAMEVSFESTVEYSVNANALNRVKAYYAARSGIELSLLRLKVYNQIQSQLGSNQNVPGALKNVLDLIWQFPFSWPPMMLDTLNDMDKGAITEKVKLSKMEASYSTIISDEGSKQDLGDLDSPSASLKESAKNRLLAIFQNKMENDEEWRKTHQNFRAEELVNNIIDWVDKDTTSLNGGDESRFYPNMPEGVRLPPNRLFRTTEELRLVAGMTDEVFDLLEKNVTVYGMRAINPNVADSAILKSIDPSVTDKVVEEVLKRRSTPNNGGPFNNAEDFWNFLNASGARVPQNIQEAIPISTDGVVNFRVKSIGSIGNVTREIEVIVFDMKKSASQVTKMVEKNNPASGGATGGAGGSGSGGSKTGQTTGNQSASKGPPRIVYWSEK